MIKFILYVAASNMGFMPKTLNEVINYGKTNGKVRLTSVNPDSVLQRVKKGDFIITKKGNPLYVIEVTDRTQENWTPDFRQMVRDLAASGSPITSVSTRTPMEKWSPSYRALAGAEGGACKSAEKTTTGSSLMDRIKARLMPQEINDVRIAMDGKICVKSNEGFVTITDDNEFVTYPEEMLLDMPAYTMSKPCNTIVVGDIIRHNGQYIKVTCLKEGRIKGLTYNGNETVVYDIKDALLNQSMAQVVLTLSGTVNGTINPLMLALMNKKGKNSDLLPFLMMGQNNGQMALNPAMLMLLCKENDSDMLLPMLMMGQQNGQAPAINPMIFALMDGEECSSKEILMLSMMNPDLLKGVFSAPVTEITEPTEEIPEIPVAEAPVEVPAEAPAVEKSEVKEPDVKSPITE